MYVPPITLERLAVLIAAALEAAAGGGELAPLLLEMADALDWMYLDFALQVEHHTRGRKRSSLMQWRAYRVHCLVERGAYLRSAVLAVLDDGAGYKTVEALTKGYREFKAAQGWRAFVSVNPDVLERDAARLPVTRRPKNRTNGHK